MTQAALNFDAPPLAQARAVGEAASRLATQKAERDCPGFSDRVRAAVLERLAQGEASGEQLTAYVKERGIPFADGRSVGGIYRSMRNKGLIVPVGDCLRANGHGTKGGSIYALGAAT